MQEKKLNSVIFLMIERLKEFFNVNNDYQLAYRLGVSQSTVASWKARDTINYSLIIAKCNNINYNWLITGMGSMLLDQLGDKDKSTELPPGPCQQCLIRERLIQAQQKAIENLEARLDNKEGQKRKVG